MDLQLVGIFVTTNTMCQSSRKYLMNNDKVSIPFSCKRQEGIRADSMSKIILLICLNLSPSSEWWNNGCVYSNVQ